MRFALPIALCVLLIGVAIIFAKRRARNPGPSTAGFVDTYDFQSKKVTRIPAAELAPGMVRVRLETGQIVWAKVSELKQGAFQHPPFVVELRDAILKLQKSLEEVYPHDYQFWEDGFRRDTHPEGEIALWLHIANVFESFCSSRTTSVEERKDAFRVLVACSNGTAETALQTVQLKAIEQGEAKSLVQKFFAKR